MNWKLILLLSLLSIPVAILAVFAPINMIEPAIWLIFFVFYGIQIVKKTNGNYFLHGMLVSVLNGFWISIIHSIFVNSYMANNPNEEQMYSMMPHFLPLRLMILVMGPVFGIVFGLISGLIAFIIGKIIKKQPK